MAWWSSRIWSSSPGPGRGTSIWAPGTTGTYGWISTRCCCVLPCCVRLSAGWQRGCGALGRRGMRAAEGGAFLAYAVADLLGVAFLPGYRWPDETARYHLPAVQGGIDGWRVGVVDDAVNAGTAVAACLEELRGRGAVPVAVATLVSLGEASTTVQARMGVPFYPASTVPSRAWPAERCPLCAEGAPYTDPLSGDVVTPLPGRGPVGAGELGNDPPETTFHWESDAPRSQDSVTGGAGPGRQPCVQRPDQRAGVLPGPGEGPAGMTAPASGRTRFPRCSYPERRYARRYPT